MAREMQFVMQLAKTGLRQFPPRKMLPTTPPANPHDTIAPQDNSSRGQLPPGQLPSRQLLPGQLPPDDCPLRKLPPQDNWPPPGQLPPIQLHPRQLPPLGCSYHHMHIRKFHCFYFLKDYFSSHSELEDYATEAFFLKISAKHYTFKRSWS